MGYLVHNVAIETHTWTQFHHLRKISHIFGRDQEHHPIARTRKPQQNQLSILTMICPHQQHLHLLFKDSPIRVVADNAKTHATTTGTDDSQRTQRRRKSEPLKGYGSPRRQFALKRAQSDLGVSRWDSEASPRTKRDVPPSGAKSLSPMRKSNVQDAMLIMPKRRRSIEHLSCLSCSLSSLDLNDTNDAQTTAAYLAAALQTLEFYETEMSALLKTTS